MRRNPECFYELIDVSKEKNIPEAWRAAWLLGHVMKKNDERLIDSIDTFIENIENAKDGYQRQVIIILLKMELNDEQEGKLFQNCLTIWEQINKIPSTRITAMKFILKTAEKFPELKSEIKLWTQVIYVEGLSPGIKNILLNQVHKIL